MYQWDFGILWSYRWLFLDGKSTLLRCINLLVAPDGGSVRVGDTHFTFDDGARLPDVKTLATFRATTGMVFQHFNIFPHMTTLQNVMEGRDGRREAGGRPTGRLFTTSFRQTSSWGYGSRLCAPLRCACPGRRSSMQ